MVIKKVLNNNAAIVLEGEKEIVVMGKGIAFQRKKGEEIDKNRAWKIFTLENKKNNNRLIELIGEIPYEYLHLSEQIIRMAEEKLGIKFNENIYLTLTDHIHFAIDNCRKNIPMRNSLLYDVRRLYKKEFTVAREALCLIREATGAELPLDEAASITLHFINAAGEREIPEMIEVMNIVSEVCNIVKYTLNIEFDEDSLSYYRFINHLKFFAERVLSEKFYEDNDMELFEMIVTKYPKAFECAKKIREFITKKYDKHITQEELLYLTVHIERLLQKETNMCS